MVLARVLLVAPDWPHRPWMATLAEVVGGNPVVPPGHAGHAVTGAGRALALESRNFQLECLATGRQPSCGLSPAVLATLQEARAPSTRALNAGRWERFSQWCATTGLSPVSCGTQGVLLFLQSLLEGGLSESTLRGYVAAISDRHIPIEGRSVGSQPLIGQFLKGARSIRPSRSPMVPSWDLQLVLRALSGSPFEPLSKLGLELLSFKTAFLLAMASAKRVSELHALSVHSSCLRLGEEGSAISLSCLTRLFYPRCSLALSWYGPWFWSPFILLHMIQWRQLDCICSVQFGP